MENQPQNPEFRINPESFHPCNNKVKNIDFKKYLFCTENSRNLEYHTHFLSKNVKILN